MSRSSYPPGSTWAREEHETGFTAILSRLVAATPGAIGAALVDAEGEAVDYAGDTIEPFELKVAAAQWRIVLAEIEKGKMSELGGAPRRLSVLTARRSFVVDALPDGYALLSVMRRNAALGHADRAIDAALHDLYVEAGWSAPPGLVRWHPIDVRCGDEGRPNAVRVQMGWRPVLSIGKVVGGLQRGEIGWRVSAERGSLEITLVRGRDDRWYADVAPYELQER
jgi:hypothetical protein